MGKKITRLFQPGKPVLVSACLVGVACRYDGASQPDERVVALARHYALIPVCPEQLGGLPTPRDPVELRAGRALTRSGQDVTAQFALGAEQVVLLAELFGAGTAILQPRSPSCGIDMIYDGTFSSRCVPGQGFLAAALRRKGLVLLHPENMSSF